LSKKIELFHKDGYLKHLYISKNYRGSWGCKSNFYLVNKLLATSFCKGVNDRKDQICYSVQYTDGSVGNAENVLIHPFTCQSIPKYELCWFKVYNCEEDYWLQGRFEDYEEDTKKFLSVDNIQIDQVTGKHDYNCFDLCVPTLIAETPEKAQWIIDNTDWGML